MVLLRELEKVTDSFGPFGAVTTTPYDPLGSPQASFIHPLQVLVSSLSGAHWAHAFCL